MPKLVPSVVRETIEDMLPAAARDEQFQLSYGHEQTVAAIVGMVDEIPRDLLTLQPKEFAKLVAAKEALRASIDIWRSHGSSGTPVDRLPGCGKQNPVTVIYNALARCPDEVPSVQPEELAFIEYADLRYALSKDIGDVRQAIANSEWKAATVLAGSVVEALLLWTLQEKRSKSEVLEAIEAAVQAEECSKPPGSLTRWGLHHYVPVAWKSNLITEDTKGLCNVLRRFRDLIHPGRAIRLTQTCDRGTAFAGAAAIDSVIRDLDKSTRLPKG